MEGAGDAPLSPEITALYAIIVVLLVVGAGLMSGLTLGLLSLDVMDLEVLRVSGSAKQQAAAGRLIPLVVKPHWLLCTLLLCNAACMEALPLFLDRLLNPVGAILLSVTAILLFGEIIPQALCSRYGVAVGSALAPMVRGLMWVCAPITWPLAKLLDWVLGHEDVTMKRQQLKAMVQLHAEGAGLGGKLTQQEVAVISGAIDLRYKTAIGGMTPLSKVFMVSDAALLDEGLVKAMLHSGHSRVPVYRGHDCGDFVGLILVKEVLQFWRCAVTPRVSQLCMRPLPRLPADTPMFELLRYFQTGNSHMVLLTAPEGSDLEEFKREKAFMQTTDEWDENASCSSPPSHSSHSGSLSLVDDNETPGGKGGSSLPRSASSGLGSLRWRLGGKGSKSKQKQGSSSKPRRASLDDGLSSRCASSACSDLAAAACHHCHGLQVHCHHCYNSGCTYERHLQAPGAVVAAASAGAVDALQSSSYSSSPGAPDTCSPSSSGSASLAAADAGAGAGQASRKGKRMSPFQSQQPHTGSACPLHVQPPSQHAWPALPLPAFAEPLAAEATLTPDDGNSLQQLLSIASAPSQPRQLSKPHLSVDVAALQRPQQPHPSGAAAGAEDCLSPLKQQWSPGLPPPPRQVAVGIITLEDVIEELMQTEIVDETDAYMDNDKTERVDLNSLMASLPPSMHALLRAEMLHTAHSLLRQAGITPAATAATPGGGGGAAASAGVGGGGTAAPRPVMSVRATGFTSAVGAPIPIAVGALSPQPAGAGAAGPAGALNGSVAPSPGGADGAAGGLPDGQPSASSGKPPAAAVPPSPTSAPAGLAAAAAAAVAAGLRPLRRQGSGSAVHALCIAAACSPRAPAAGPLSGIEPSACSAPGSSMPRPAPTVALAIPGAASAAAAAAAAAAAREGGSAPRSSAPGLLCCSAGSPSGTLLGAACAKSGAGKAFKSVCSKQQLAPPPAGSGADDKAL